MKKEEWIRDRQYKGKKVIKNGKKSVLWKYRLRKSKDKTQYYQNQEWKIISQWTVKGY